MSNPLAIFRKHQKILLAIFGVALMLVFTVGGIVSQYMGAPGSSGEDAVVVRIDSGDQLGLENLKESQMQNLRYSRIFLQNFMRSVNYLAASRGGEPRQWLGVPIEDNEQSLLRTLLLSRKASEMGIVVTDESIRRYLRSYSSGKIDDREFGELLKSVSQGRISQPQFFDAMRNELLALRFLELFYRGIDPLPPATSWDYFQRLNRQVAIEAAPFPVASYLSQVGEPSDAEVAQLYEEGKDRYPMPNSPDPGFKQRKKIALEYVKADLQTFLEEEKPKISDAEIAVYYEANKQEFRTIGSTPSNPTSPGASQTPAGDVNLPFDLLEEDPSSDGATTDPATSENPLSTDDLAPTEDPAAPEATGPDVLPETADDAPEPDAPAPQPLQDDPTDEGPKVNQAPPEDLQPVDEADDSTPGEPQTVEAELGPQTEEPSAPAEDEPIEDSETGPAEEAPAEEPMVIDETETAEPEATTEVPETESAETEEAPVADDEMELGPLPEAGGGNVPGGASGVPSAGGGCGRDPHAPGSSASTGADGFGDQRRPVEHGSVLPEVCGLELGVRGRPPTAADATGFAGAGCGAQPDGGQNSAGRHPGIAGIGSRHRRATI